MTTFVTTLIGTIKKHAKPAAIAIILFLGVAFSFIVKGDQREALGTALVKAEQVEAKAAVQAEETEADYKVGGELEKMEVLPPQQVDQETLWLARGIYSETKRPQEQELVAWTLRNRVETEYRGNGSYQEAVLDPYQYSAFIEGTATREHYTSLTPASQEEGFQNAIAIAKQVKEASASERPFAQTTRHFYSEQSMVGGKAPNWAVGETPVTPERPIKLEARRFRFYADIS